MSTTAPTRRNRPAPAPSEASAIPPRWNLLLCAAFMAWTLASLIYPLSDTDFWWHLKTGELILKEGKPPQVDWYTFTDFDKPWIDLHWGFQVLITLLYHLGGASLVVVTKAVVISAAVGVAWLASGRSIPAWLKVLLWIPGVIAISGRGYERPEMFSQLFLSTWLLVAFRVERQPRLIWILPAVQLLWVNFHSLFVLGLVVGGCYAADYVLRQVARGRWGLEPAPQAPLPRTLIRAGGLVALACFLSPYFEEGALFPLTVYRKFTVEQGFYSVHVGEFQQPIRFVMKHGLANIYLIAELVTWLLTAASFVAAMMVSRRWSVIRLLLFAAFSHLAWEAARNTNIFSLVAGVVLCANVGDVLAVRGLRLTFPAQRRLSLAAGATLAGLLVLVVTSVWDRLGEGNKPFRLGEAENYFMHDAAKFAGQPGFPERAFVCNNGQAAVYIYHNCPERLVFMDGRLEVCTIDTFKQFNWIIGRMSDADPAWQAVFTLSNGSLPAVLLDSRTSLLPLVGMLHTPGWRMVYADAVAGVFLDDATADRLKLPAVDRSALRLPERIDKALDQLDSSLNQPRSPSHIPANPGNTPLKEGTKDR